jgi:predicted ribosome quality control (RQC) complex YloA/Tae2 family protein
MEPSSRDLVRQYLAVCKRTLRSLRKKLEKQEVERNEAMNYIRYQQIADSLLAHPVTCPKGTSRTVIINVHTQTEEQIKLNPAFDAVANAELLYKKARKGKRGLEITCNNVEQTSAQIAEMETLSGRCESLAAGAVECEPAQEEVDAVRERLQQLELLPRETAAAGPVQEQLPFRHLTIDGWDVYVGKNDQQNDELTTRYAKPWDLWLHVAAHAGSHVVLRKQKNGPNPPANVVRKAAGIAAWFSKAKHSSYVMVHMAEARYVWKPRKAPPGEVAMRRCETIQTAPLSPQDLGGEAAV